MKDSRVSAEGIRRRRQCVNCSRRFTTYEHLGQPAIKVQKRDGRFVPFDSNKIVKALSRVGRDRAALGPADQQRLARTIEAELLDAAVKTIRSGEIVDRLLRLLKDVDRVAYDRLAANYLDEAGRLRTDVPKSEEPSAPQLGLFEDDEEAP